MPAKKTKEEFIINSQNINGDRYIYDQVIYQRSDKKVKIICRIHGMFLQTPSSHLSGKNCPKCALDGAFLSLNEFIDKANGIYHGTYNYSKSIYINFRTNIEIICNNCNNIFWQQPGRHLNGAECNKCVKSKKLAQKFLEKVINIHGNLYSYKNMNYINSYTKIVITCHIHGDFEQLPSGHLSGYGCSQCGLNKVHKQNILPMASIISEMNIIHNNKYQYNILTYKNTRSKMEIICSLHGSFWQKVNSHLNGHGCPDCSGKKVLTKEIFINRSNIKHNNKYSYDEVIYKNNHTKVKIICPEHGIFFQSPLAHMDGQGCSCCSSSISRGETEWLNSLHIPKEYRNKILKINGRKFWVDAFISESNIIYEYNGDYWHGNPKIFNPNDKNRNNGKTFKKLYEDTIWKENFLKQEGYTVISIWENDWKNK